MDESSVIFNLNEIMRLERERVTAEEAAARAAEAHAAAQRQARVREQRERAAHEQAAREHAAAERDRLAREAALAEENERAAALLRVKLEAEAAQRLADRQLELTHTAKLHELAEAQRKKRASWLMAGSLLALCLASSAAYAYVLEPALRSARERSAALDQLTAAGAAQTAALAREIEDLRAAQARAAQNLSDARTASTARPAKATKPNARVRGAAKPVTSAPTTNTPLDTLDSTNDDPLFGLDSPTPKRKR